MKTRKHQWEMDEGFKASLFWHPGGPLPGELQTNRSRGVWIERNGDSTWIARSWEGAYDQMYEMGYQETQ